MKKATKETIRNDPHKRVRGAVVNSISIPLDLILEILAKCPPKSIVKFICVSKLWCSIIRGKVFTDLFLTRSMTRPLFLFKFNRGNNRFLLSVSQEAPFSGHQTPSIIAKSGMCNISPPIRGLICCQIDSKMVISNPSTGQIVNLPEIKTTRRGIFSYFGYDPVKDEYKMLAMTVLLSHFRSEAKMSEEHQVFTLGKGQKAWRMIDCKHPHSPVTTGICNNGVVYYGAKSINEEYVMMGFNVRTEEFTLANLPDSELKTRTCWSELVSYNKKIALMNHLELSGKVELLVLEDFDKQEWSKIIIEVPSWRELAGNHFLFCRGTTNSSEFIFAPSFLRPDPFFIIMYDHKKNIARKIEIEGLNQPFHSVEVFFDHVESPLLLEKEVYC